MGLFGKSKNLDKVHSDLEYYKAESEMLAFKSDAEERRAVIKQLEKEYGPGWKKLLSVTSKENIQTLRSFLGAFKDKSKKIHAGKTKNLTPLANSDPKKVGMDLSHLRGNVMGSNLPKY